MRSRAELRAFASRDRRVVDEDKTRYWVAWKHRHGVAGAIALADDLRRQARLARPDWPSEADRLDDLRAHLRLSALLQRVPYPRR